MWFTEDAWSPIILCLVGAVIFLIAASSTQNSRYRLAIPVLLLAALTIYFLEQSLVTDRERVEENLHGLISTFVAESQQIAKGSVPEHLQVEEFFSLQNTADRMRVAAAVAVVSVGDDIRITDVDVQLTNNDTRAVTHFRANATISAGNFNGHHPSRWELTWQKEGGDWKITRTRMLNIMNGEEQRIPQVD